MKKLDDKKFRHAFVESNVRRGLAYQLRALRKANKDMSQATLGSIIGKPQNVVSRLENPNYGKWTIKTLLEVAAGFDVAVIVKFVPFSRLRRESENLSQEELAPLSYDIESKLKDSGTFSTWQGGDIKLYGPSSTHLYSLDVQMESHASVIPVHSWLLFNKYILSPFLLGIDMTHDNRRLFTFDTPMSVRPFANSRSEE